MYPVRADKHHQSQADAQHARGDGIGDAGDLAGLQADIRQLFVDPVKPLFFVLGLAEGLDDPDAGDIFLHHPHHFVQGGLLLCVHGDTLLGHKIHHDTDNRKQSNENQRQSRVHHQHHGDTAQQQHGRADTHPLQPCQQLIDVVGIAGEPGLGRGHGKAVHLLGGQALQLGKEVMPHSLGDFSCADGAHAVGQNVKAQAAQGAQNHTAAVEIDGL